MCQRPMHDDEAETYNTSGKQKLQELQVINYSLTEYFRSFLIYLVYVLHFVIHDKSLLCGKKY